jgi:hypothetical protein
MPETNNGRNFQIIDVQIEGKEGEEEGKRRKRRIGG